MTVPVNRAMMASQAATADSTQILQFPKDISTHGMLMIFNQYTFIRPTSSTSAQFTPLLNARNLGSVVEAPRGAILLPIPSTLIDKTSLRIQPFSMAESFGGETAAALASAVKTAASPNMTLKDGWQFSLPTGISPVDIVGLAKRLQVGGNLAWIDSISQGVGITQNPKTSLLFKGVDLKDYSFEWTLAPTEQDESMLLRRIIQKLKANSLPDYNRESLTTSVMLSYPLTVDIYLLGVDPDYYLQFKRAMIQNVTVNYTPHGLSLLKGGRPSAVNLSISLTEMDIHISTDYGRSETWNNTLTIDELLGNTEDRR